MINDNVTIEEYLDQSKELIEYSETSQKIKQP